MSAKKHKNYRRHPAHVTSDRVKDAYERYFDKLSESERYHFEYVIHALEEIGDGNR